MEKLSSEIHKRIVRGIVLISINILSVLIQTIFMPFNFTETNLSMKIPDGTVHKILAVCGLIQLVLSLILLVKYKKSLGTDISLHKKARHFNFIVLIMDWILVMLIFSAFLILSLCTLFLTMDLWFRLLMPSFVVCFSSLVFLTLALMQNNISV